MLAQFAIPSDYLMPVLGYFLLANALALALFGLNRANSEDGDWGGPEMRVLLLSLMGGWIGAKLGRIMYPAEEEPRSFGTLLNLSVLALPIVVITPWVMTQAPGWIGTAYAAYTAQYVEAQAQAEASRVSPLGAAYQSGDMDAEPDATGVVAAAEDSPAGAIAEAGGRMGAVVTGAAEADAEAPLLPRRFGPGTEKKSKKGGIKFLSAPGK